MKRSKKQETVNTILKIFGFLIILLVMNVNVIRSEDASASDSAPDTSQPSEASAPESSLAAPSESTTSSPDGETSSDVVPAPEDSPTANTEQLSDLTDQPSETQEIVEQQAQPEVADINALGGTSYYDDHPEAPETNPENLPEEVQPVETQPETQAEVVLEETKDEIESPETDGVELVGIYAEIEENNTEGTINLDEAIVSVPEQNMSLNDIEPESIFEEEDLPEREEPSPDQEEITDEQIPEEIVEEQPTEEPSFDLDLKITDSDDKEVSAEVTVLDQNNEEVTNVSEGGAYTLDIDVNGIPIKEVELKGVQLDSSLDIGIDEIEDSGVVIPDVNQEQILGAVSFDPKSTTFEQGNIKVKAEGNYFYKCDDFNFENEMCLSEWKQLMEVNPDQTYAIPVHDQDKAIAIASVNLIILNVQSYPVVGGTWEVRFETKGIADLEIKAIDETTWSNTKETEDLKLLSIACGNDNQPFTWSDGAALLNDYSCDETNYETSKVLTAGKHDLQFTFGTEIAYAHNNASPGCLDVDSDLYQIVDVLGTDCGPIDCNDDNGTAFIDTTYYYDYDMDTYSSDLSIQLCSNGQNQSGLRTSSDHDCYDNDTSVYPGASEICGDGIDQDCSGADLLCFVDADNDGFSNSTDCNDNNSIIFPGANETPYNGIDEDCSGADKVDVDNDNFNATIVNGTDCNDNNSLINPSKSEIPFNGVDDDCNNVTLESPIFNITINKAKYNLSEQVEIALKSPNGTTVILTVNGGQQPYSDSTSGPFPITYLFTDTSKSGTYAVSTIFTYLGYTQTKNLNFEVKDPTNPLSVLINPSNTTVNEGGQILFDASIVGNQGALQYQWDFESDGTIDSTTSNPSFTFTKAGSFVVKLVVKDGINNATALKNIFVRKKYNVQFSVRDKTTDEKISGANVSVNNDAKQTDGEGLIVFDLIEGDYSVVVNKEGYPSASRTVTVNTNKTETFQLEKTVIDDSTPSVDLFEPGDNPQSADGNLRIKYKANDNSLMKCTIFSSPDETWWKKLGIQTGVRDNEEKEYFVQNLDDGDQFIKVECSDGAGNLGSSKVLKVTVGESAITEIESGDKTDVLLEKVETSLNNLNSQNSNVKEFMTSMGLDKELEKYKTDIKRIKRDLFNLKWRTLDEAGLEAEKKKMYDRLDEIEQNTPESIAILNTKEFIKYPTEKEIQDVVMMYLKEKQPSLSEKEKKQWGERIFKLQSLALIAAKATSAEIEYLSGNTETVTLIDKTIAFEKNESDHVIVEFIPKEFAESAKEITFTSVIRVIKDDPLVELDFNDQKRIAYSVKKNVGPEIAEQTLSLVLPKDLEASSKSPITGFAIFDVGSLIKTKNKTRVIIEVMVVLLLVLFYVLYPFNNPQLASLRQELTVAMQEIQNKKYDAALQHYKKASELFKAIPPKKKTEVKPHLVSLHADLDGLFIANLVEKAHGHLKEEKLDDAYELYFKVRHLYKQCSKEQKQKVYEQCSSLFEKFNQLKK